MWDLLFMNATSVNTGFPLRMPLVFTKLETMSMPQLLKISISFYHLCTNISRINCFIADIALIFPSLGHQEVEQIIRSKMTKQQGIWLCTDCDYTTKKSSNLYEHIESRHCPTAGYTCGICAKFCPTRNAMRNHNVRYHQTSKV